MDETTVFKMQLLKKKLPYNEILLAKQVKVAPKSPNIRGLSALWRFFCAYKAVVAFESVKEILKCDHSNESY